MKETRGMAAVSSKRASTYQNVLVEHVAKHGGFPLGLPVPPRPGEAADLNLGQQRGPGAASENHEAALITRTDPASRSARRSTRKTDQAIEGDGQEPVERQLSVTQSWRAGKKLPAALKRRQIAVQPAVSRHPRMVRKVVPLWNPEPGPIWPQATAWVSATTNRIGGVSPAPSADRASRESGRTGGDQEGK
jgi:hypothetical protein